MHVIHEQKENGQVEKLSQPITEDVYKKRMDIFLDQQRFPPAQKLVTRKLASESFFDDNAWSEENWQETLKKRDIDSSSVNVRILSNECTMPKQTPFNTEKPKFSEMNDEDKKEYFKKLYKKRKHEKKLKLLDNEENERKLDVCSNVPIPVNVGNGISQSNTAGPQKYATTKVISNTNSQEKVPKILLIGDSISANINIGHLAHATNAKFSQERAYSSVNETASNIYKQLPKFPNLNFTEVVPAELRKGNFHYLVLQAPSVDITNLNTNVHLYSKYFQQETCKSAKNFFSVVENALEVKPTLHKVIVLKLIPRYDPPSVDPLGLKSDLSRMFNEELEELCMNSRFQSKIFVGSHNIDCTGAIRESRYFFAEFSNNH